MKNRSPKRIYLDYAASTPIDKRVIRATEKVQTAAWANASSLHQEGGLSKNILEQARIRAARVLQCKKSNILFTSGGTESCNIAIQGVVRKSKNKLPHIITSTIEHPAVLEPIKNLVVRGEAEVSFVAPNEEGIINPESIKRELKETTVLVAIMYANNEIGTIQPISKISAVIREFKSHNSYPIIHTPYLFVDASQGVLFEDVSLDRLGADLIALDGIKMYGPRGVGLLVMRHGVEISPVFFGGGQEGGLRSGTENAIGAVGIAEALEIAKKMREKESKRLTDLRDYAISKILKEFPNSSLNGSKEKRLPNNINICFASPKHDSEFLVIKLDTLGFSVSAASACNTLSLENSSYVIEALGKPACAGSSLRFTLGRSTKKSDLDELIVALKKVVTFS